VQAARVAVCCCVHGSVRTVRVAVCSSFVGSVWQCALQCAAVQQCGSVRQCAAVCGSASVAVLWQCAAVCSSVRQCVALHVVVCGSALYVYMHKVAHNNSIYWYMPL
jgi:hypothetical protein